MNKSVLITGAGGQDAYFTSRYIKRNTNYSLYGISNNDYSKYLGTESLKFFDYFEKLSLCQHEKLSQLINNINPTYIFNFGAVAGSLTQFSEPSKLIETNSLSILNILETLKSSKLKTKFIQASSSEIFASNNEFKQQISSLRKPRTIYGASKIFSDSLIEVYRKQYDVDCFSAILFSHESPLRKNDYFSKKLINQIFDYTEKKINKIKIYSPMAKRDWGYAGDYCTYIAKKALSDNKSDILVGSGVPHTVKDFAEEALSHFNLSYNDVVEEVDLPKNRASEESYVFLDPQSMDSYLTECIKYDLRKLVNLLIRHMKLTRYKKDTL